MAARPDARASSVHGQPTRRNPDERHTGARLAGGLTAKIAALVRERFGTPCYVYDRAALEAAARQALAVPAPYGLTLRYAMKANPSQGILALFRDLGLHVDASSDFEVERALRAGFPPERVQLTSQMPSRRLAEHVRRGVLFNACSLHQLEESGVSRRAGRFRCASTPVSAAGRPSGRTRRAGVELRNLARIPGRGHGRSRASPPEDHAAARPHRIGTDRRSGSAWARMTLDTAAASRTLAS